MLVALALVGLASIAHSAAPADPAPPAPIEQAAPPIEPPPPGAEVTAPATDASPLETSPQSTTGLSPTDPLPPTGVSEELELIRPGPAIKKALDRFAEKTNLRFGLANTLLFQQASGGPGERTAAGGDLDLYAKWTLIGAGTKDTGQLAFSGEYRYQIGEQPPSALGPEIGTLLATTNGFNERPPTVKELYWDQRLFEDRFRFIIGRVDPENFFGGHRLQSANLYFLDKAISTNPTVAYPGPGFAAAAQIKPVPWFYLSGGITDANGKATVSNFEGFFKDHEYLLFTEAALTPVIEGVGAGRYRVALWHIDKRENAGVDSDAGVTVSCDQDFGDAWTAFVRYGHAEGDVTNVTDSVQGGFARRNLLMKDSMLGLALAWSEPFDSGKRDEKLVECFARFQVTEVVQFMVGVEVIFDPSNAPEDDVLGVFSARLRVSF